jgi:PAS domain-containing protein
VGPALRWTILERDRLRLGWTGAYAATDRGNAIAFGLQFQLLGARSQIHAAVGAQSGGGPWSPRTEPAVVVGASVQRGDRSGGLVNANALLQHSGDATLAQAGADVRGPAGYVAATVVQRLADGANSRQYGLSAQTTLGLGSGTLHLGAREQTDSVIAVRLRGPKRTARFEILVDEAVRGVLHPGERLAIAVQPYRRYAVRLRATGDPLWTFDTRTRHIDMHPGTYRTLDWSARPVLAMFGRLVGPAGAPIRNGDITTDDAVAATDDRGYFQIQTGGNASMTVHATDGATCTATLDAPDTTAPFVALGDVPCRP